MVDLTKKCLILGLQGNPLSPEISKLYHESNGAQKLLQFLLDHLASQFTFILLHRANRYLVKYEKQMNFDIHVTDLGNCS
jgi:hypothetical protein